MMIRIKKSRIRDTPMLNTTENQTRRDHNNRVGPGGIDPTLAVRPENHLP